MGRYGLPWDHLGVNAKAMGAPAGGLMIGNCSLTLPRLKEWLSNRPAAGAPAEGATWPSLGPVLAPTILANLTAMAYWLLQVRLPNRRQNAVRSLVGSVRRGVRQRYFCRLLS